MLTDNGVFDKYWDEIMTDVIADPSTESYRIIGINNDGVTALAKDAANPTLDDIISNNYNTHGPTDLTVGYSAGKLTANSLDDTFTDSNNGNGDTKALIVYIWTGVDNTSRLVSFNVLATARPQDGVNDDVTLGASNPIVQLY